MREDRDNKGSRHGGYRFAGLAALSVVSCGGTSPADLFGNPTTAGQTDAGLEPVDGALGTDVGARNLETTVSTLPADAGAQPTDTDAGLRSGPSVEAAAPNDADSTLPFIPPFDDAGMTAVSDAGISVDSPNETRPTDDAARSDADATTDVCLSPPSGNNAITAPGFESSDRGKGWTGFGGCNFETTSAFAHCGTHSGRCTDRATTFQGPGYDLPLTPARYSVSAWVLQDGATTTTLLWNAKLVCAGVGGDSTSYPPVSAPVVVPPRTWVLTTGTFVVPSGCNTARLYLNQWNDPLPVVLPDLYVDDVYAIY